MAHEHPQVRDRTVALGVLALLLLVVAMPIVLRPKNRAAWPEDTQSLIILTPHVQQIREEFARAFDQWHQAKYGTRVRIDWRIPGGTSEIRRLLEAKYGAAIRQGKYTLDEHGVARFETGALEFDMMFGGGSYDHGKLAANNAARAAISGEEVAGPISAPPEPPFEQSQLDGWFGENVIGTGKLYHDDQYWFGTALSGFGFLYNRDVLRRLGVAEPKVFDDLTNPKLMGWIALVDPRMSGSVATLYESILNAKGFDEGWRILREMSANSRTFASSSTRTPIDVGQGEAAIGVCIDFYGRSQAQSVSQPGTPPELARVGYADPANEVYVDADPISILAGAPNPVVARHFVEFCLTEQGQSLWQFHARETGYSSHQTEDGLGPAKYELRRMPARRSMYERYMDRFVDKANPFLFASDAPNLRLRGSINVLMSSMAIDAHDELHHAWKMLNKARATSGFPASALAEMEAVFYAMPEVVDKDGQKVLLSAENATDFGSLWRDEITAAEARIACTRFFKGQYARVVVIAHEHGVR
ncbi:MAG: extracellular solute-binding protein [Phycisphaeraceae bacterium]|nr:extracellular solute-binding protein [Phycisphaerales bacterium]MCB9859060.1 extracellular solute-binding protein [Phycisphaeraceae bacterium]